MKLSKKNTMVEIWILPKESRDITIFTKFPVATLNFLPFKVKQIGFNSWHYVYRGWLKRKLFLADRIVSNFAKSYQQEFLELGLGLGTKVNLTLVVAL